MSERGSRGTQARVGAVVFDLDGTLVDSREDIFAACLHALVAHGRPSLPLAEIAGYVGDGARTLIARAARLEPSDAALEPLLATYLDYYRAHSHDRTVLLPGAGATLEALADLPLALCTYKPRGSTEPLLEHLDLSRRFAAVIAAEDVVRHKPHPDPLWEIAGRLGLPAETLVMVGDGPQDIEAGRRAGTRTVGIPGPFLPRECLAAASPDALLDRIDQLPSTLEPWR